MTRIKPYSGYRTFNLKNKKVVFRFYDEWGGTTKEWKKHPDIKKLRKKYYVRLTNGKNQDGDKVIRIWVKSKRR